MDRRCIRVEWPKSRMNLYIVADTHIGSAYSLEKQQEELANTIANDEYAAVLGLGDYVEAIDIGDKRFDANELSQPISPQFLSNTFYVEALRFSKIWQATANKWLVATSGTHEVKAVHRNRVDVVPIIGERLGIPYVVPEQCTWIRISFMNPNHPTKSLDNADIFAIHGWGGGELRGSDALKLQRLCWKKRADVVVTAHTHRGQVIWETIDKLNSAGNEESALRWGVSCPPMCGKHKYLAERGGNIPPSGFATVIFEMSVASRGPVRISAHITPF